MDTFVLLVGDDGRLGILRADDSGDLEEMQISDALASQKWQSGSLYDDVNDAFHLASDAEEDDLTSVLMFLLGPDGGLQVMLSLMQLQFRFNHNTQVYRMPDLENPIYLAPGLGFLPPFLSVDFTVRRSNARERLMEILVADLGDKFHRSPFLIVRPFIMPRLPLLIEFSYGPQKTI